ncbi:TatD family hydrolase [Candidatus Daviesbacteria bacterium]|nr:TatD family hydrolase [Candidatus Daviesbacteria bacterium]
MLTDTHAHLYWESFKKDFDEVLKRALEAGVSTIINVGVNLEKSQEALQQVKGKLAGIPGLDAYSTIGIHPHEALCYVQGKLSEDIEKLELIYHSAPEKVVAVGECGLDITPTDLQIKLFQIQIDLAKKLNLPLIIHCRDDRSQDPQNSECWDKVIDMTKDHFGIYHCYSGLPHTTNYILRTTNFLVSFAATITYPKNDYLRKAAQMLPLERIVLETDSPFLPPQSKRGQRNEPSFITEVVDLIAQIKGVSLVEVEHQTAQNAKKLFKLVARSQI